MKLNNDWYHAFGGSFQDEEDVIDFIFERLNTSDFEDGGVDCAGYGEPNECVVQTANNKRDLLYDFMIDLIERANRSNIN